MVMTENTPVPTTSSASGNNTHLPRKGQCMAARETPPAVQVSDRGWKLSGRGKWPWGLLQVVPEGLLELERERQQKWKRALRTPVPTPHTRTADRQKTWHHALNQVIVVRRRANRLSSRLRRQSLHPGTAGKGPHGQVATTGTSAEGP